MKLRSTNSKADRIIPLNTKGQSLLSGNIFCDHCGGRLVIITSGKVVRMRNGETKGTKRIRYICYNKARKHIECAGKQVIQCI